MPISTALGCVQCPPTRMLSAATITPQRQERNGPRSGTAYRPGIAFSARLASLGSASLGWASLGWASLGWVRLGWVSLAALALPEFAAHATTTERVVVNRYSGLAIEGFDPVAYFVDARPMVRLPYSQTSHAPPVCHLPTHPHRA